MASRAAHAVTVAEHDVEAALKRVAPFVKSHWYIGICCLWFVLILFVGMVPALATRGAEYAAKLAIPLPIALVTCGLVILAHGQRNIHFAWLVLLFSAAAIVTSLEALIVLHAEMTTCRDLYDDEAEYARVLYNVGTAPWAVVSATVQAGTQIGTLGVMCLGLRFTSDNQYRLHMAALFVACLANVVLPLLISCMTLLEIPRIHEYAVHKWNLERHNLGVFIHEHLTHKQKSS